MTEPRMTNIFVYVITNKNRSTLYIGMTNNLERRLWEHRNKVVSGFSADYSLCQLLYHESFRDARSAIEREKQLKGWPREKKIDLIETMNPHWEDLSEGWVDDGKS